MRSSAVMAVLLTAAVTPTVSAFLPGVSKPDAMRPDLMDITQKQLDTKLNLRLDIGKKGQSQMAITGMVLELANDRAVADNDRVRLPGFDGPHPDLSCGPRRLDLVERGRFINMMGTQQVDAVNGCWEMSWREGKPAGTLICGFEVPKEHQRNQATLPKGVVYCSFPLWTKEGLSISQAQKELVSKRAQKLLAEQDAELAKHNNCRNPLMRVVHFRKAMDAFDEYSTLPLKSLESIPSSDNTVLLQDDLLLSTKGIVWMSHGDFKDAKHTVLGSASVTSTSKAANNNNNNNNNPLMP